MAWGVVPEHADTFRGDDMRIRTWLAGAAAAAVLAACGGGEIVAVVSFLGSAGGDWRVDNSAQPGFQPRSDCGAQRNEACVINIQPIDRSLFTSTFRASFTGNLPGCPAQSRDDGIVSAGFVTLPGCFVGRYESINEVLSDDGSVRAYFDSEVPDLSVGVWVEIQREQRRFKFQDNASGCELTTPTRTPVAVTIAPADIDAGRLQTQITDFTVGGETWTGNFVGISGIRLVRGNDVLELQRLDLADDC
jgi:hypothetical protein